MYIALVFKPRIYMYVTPERYNLENQIKVLEANMAKIPMNSLKKYPTRFYILRNKVKTLNKNLEKLKQQEWLAQ